MAKRARIYTPYFPYPATEGAFQVICDQSRNLLAQGWEVQWISWKDRESRLFARRRALERAAELKGIRCEHWKSRLDVRPARVLRSFVSELASPEIFYYPPALDQRAELPPVDLAIYHFSFAYAWLRGGAAPPKQHNEGKRVIHFHNLESELFRQRASHSRFPLSRMQSLNMRKLRAHEGDLGALVDELWFLTEKDRDAYRHAHPDVAAPLRVVGPSFNPALRARRRVQFESIAKETRAGHALCAGFLGALDFGPNQASLRWILEHVCPLLAREGFNGRLLVAGKNASRALHELAAPYPFVEFLGFIDDPEPFWARLSFLLAPHIEGSGSRIKLLEALASGIPILTNPDGAALLPEDLRAEKLLEVSDDPLTWARHLLSETPFARRRALQNVAFPPRLSGAADYASD